MTNDRTEQKALVLTVGTGDADNIERTLLGPMLLSIRHGKWDRVVLLPSHETQKVAQVLSKRLQAEGYPHIAIETLPEKGQENNADACFGRFDSVLAQLLVEGFAPGSIVADFTRGTKAMSAALVLAAVGRDIPILRYVHSEQRDNRGMVVPGTEKVGEIRTTLATVRRRLDLAANLMRRGDFGAVIELLPDLNNKMAVKLVPQAAQPKFAALRAAAQIYAAWDRLDYKAVQTAMKQLGPTAREADAFAPTPAMRQWLKRLARRPEQTDRAKMADYLRMLACDLLANAERRLRDRHFEDALLRGYRVLELVGQTRLFARGYDSAALPADDETIKTFQEKLQGRGEHGFGENKSGQNKGTLTAPRELTARLLKHLGDPLAERLLKFGLQGKFRTSSRNRSVLIHGFKATALDEDALRKVLADLEELLNEDDEKAGERLKVGRSLLFSVE